MKNGGTVVFDTRDALTASPGGPPTPEGLWLRTLLAGVDVPELEPVPRDHVVTKTFYLIDRFVGRTDDRPDLDRGAAAARSQRPRAAPGARRRQRFADHHHLQRSRRRLGGRRRAASRCIR